MGCSATKTQHVLELPRREGNLSGTFWFSIGTAHFSNLIQEAKTYPQDYIIYDTRSEKEFLASTIHGALWAWEFNVRDPTLVDGKKKKKHDPPPLPLQNQYFLKSLGAETNKKIVLVWGDNLQSPTLTSFIDCLGASKMVPRTVCVLRRGYRSLRNERYRHLFTNVNPNPAGPVEILPPGEDSYGPCLLLSGSDALELQKAVVARWLVNAVINLGERKLKARPGCELVVYAPSATGGAPCLEQAAAGIATFLQQGKTVLVVDDFGGRQWGAGACVALLMAAGVMPEAAVHHIKENKPSAELDFCRAALSLTVKRPYKLAAARSAFRARNKTNYLPMSALEKKNRKVESTNFEPRPPADVRRYSTSRYPPEYVKGGVIEPVSVDDASVDLNSSPSQSLPKPASLEQYKKNRSKTLVRKTTVHPSRKTPSLKEEVPMILAADTTVDAEGTYYEMMDSMPPDYHTGVEYVDEHGNTYYYEELPADDGVEPDAFDFEEQDGEIQWIVGESPEQDEMQQFDFE